MKFIQSKPYEEMTATERYSAWVNYKNACELCVTWDGRNDQELITKRNGIADEMYHTLIKYFTKDDIQEPKKRSGK